MTRLLHAEWTKLRTVRSWAIAAVLIAVVLVRSPGSIASGNHAGICTGPGPGSCHGEPPVPIGPNGEAVADSYYFLHEPLTGNGSITVQCQLADRSDLDRREPRPGRDQPARPGQACARAMVEGRHPDHPKPVERIAVRRSHGDRRARGPDAGRLLHDIAGMPGAVTIELATLAPAPRSGDPHRLGLHRRCPLDHHQHDSPERRSRAPFRQACSSPHRSFRRPRAANEGTYATATFDQLA